MKIIGTLRTSALEMKRVHCPFIRYIYHTRSLDVTLEVHLGVRKKERWLASPLTRTGMAFELACYLHIRLRLPTLLGGSITQFFTYQKKSSSWASVTECNQFYVNTHPCLVCLCPSVWIGAHINWGSFKSWSVFWDRNWK